MKEKIIAWLAGLISTDGSIKWQGKNKLKYEIYSSEKYWLQQIKKILELAEIESNIRNYGKPNLFVLYLKNPSQVTKMLRNYGLDYLIQRKAQRVIDADYEFSREDLIRLVKEPAYFAKKLFDIDLYSYQIKVLETIKPEHKTIVIKGRKIGLSYAAAIGALWWAATHPKHKVLIVSLYKDQAKIILNYVKEILYRKPELLNEFIDLPWGLTKTKFTFRNGATIEATGCNRPYGDNVRGKDADFLIVDECVLLYDKQWAVVEPLTAHSKGPRLYISTAGGEGSTFHRQVKYAEHEEDVTLFELPACKREGNQIKDILCPAMDEKRLLSALRDLKPLSFDREYCCRWVGMENQVFTKFKILKPGEIWECGPHHYVGIDVGQVNNPTVLTVIRGDYDRAKVIFTREWRREETQEQLLYELRSYFAELLEATKLYRFTCLSTDDYVDSLALAYHPIAKPTIVDLPSTVAVERRA